MVSYWASNGLNAVLQQLSKKGRYQFFNTELSKKLMVNFCLKYKDIHFIKKQFRRRWVKSK